jgi:hypothetical protein
MSHASGRRPDIALVELDPGMGLLAGRPLRESDHEFGVVPLLAEEPKEHERAHQARRILGRRAEGAVNRTTETLRRMAAARPTADGAESCDRDGQLAAMQQATDARIREPHASRERELLRE